MAVKIPTDQIQDLQQVEVAVAGPDGANRLFIISGRVNTSVFAQSVNNNNVVTQKETLMVLMGPVLKRRQFISASGTAGLTGSQSSLQSAPAIFGWGISALDADWDDQSEQVELTIEINVSSLGTNNHASVNVVSFQVVVLAEIAP